MRVLNEMVRCSTGIWALLSPPLKFKAEFLKSVHVCTLEKPMTEMPYPYFIEKIGH